MGVFTRFRDIVSSNINGMLDRAEDPEKLIKLMIQEMEETLIELKAACAGVMAESKTVRRQLKTVGNRTEYWENKAELAVQKGREDLAREALLEKHRYTRSLEALENELIAHDALFAQYGEDICQLEEKLKNAREKQRILVQRHLHARQKIQAQEEIRKIESTDAMLKFDELENRIERMEAEADLVNFGRESSLAEELERLSVDDDIEKELAAMKSSSVNRMEERVDNLETILADESKGESENHERV